MPPAADFKPFPRASLWLLGLAWTLPFLQPYHRFPLASFYSEWLAFALGLAALLPLLRRAHWQEAAIPVVAVAPLGLALLLAIQVGAGRVPYAEQALTAALYLAWAALMIVLGHALRRGAPLPETVTTLAWFLLAGGILSALAGLAQHWMPGADAGHLVMRKEGPMIYGNLGQPNHFASYTAIALASAAYLYARGRLAGAAMAGCSALFLLVLVLAGSRSPWLYIATFIALSQWLLRRAPGDDSRRLARAALWLLPGFVLMQALIVLPTFVAPEWAAAPRWDATWTSGERVFRVADGIAPRLELWGDAWRMFLAAPLLGAGFGQFPWNHFIEQGIRGAGAAAGVYSHAHNILLHLLAEFGLAGAALVAWMAVHWLADVRRGGLDPERWWLLSLGAVIGIHSLLEFPLWYAYFLGMACVVLGLGAERVFVVRRAGLARAVTAVAVATGCLHVAAVIAPYRDFERLLFVPGASESIGERALAEAMEEIHREPLLTPYVELALAYGATADGAHLEEKLALVTRAVRFAPVSVLAYRQAHLLALARDGAAAQLQLERALRAYPEEAGEAVEELGRLARDNPAAFTPLLKSAVSWLGEWQAPAAAR